MPTTDAFDPPDSPAAPADSGLRCPTCGYNLTGIAEGENERLCPECGNLFDSEKLRAILAGLPVNLPIPVWDEVGRGLPDRFVTVCLLTWFRPGQFARTFPLQHDLASSRRFRLLVTAVSVVLAFSALGSSPSLITLAYLLCAMSGLAAAAPVFEMFMGVAWATVFHKRRDRFDMKVEHRCEKSCAALAGMFRSYIILFTLAILFALWSDRIGVLAFLAVGIWLYISLLRVAVAKAVEQWRAVLTGIHALICAAVACFVAGIASYAMLAAITLVHRLIE